METIESEIGGFGKKTEMNNYKPRPGAKTASKPRMSISLAEQGTSLILDTK